MITKRYQAKNSNNDNHTSNSIFNIYHAFFRTNNFFRITKKVLRIRCSIMFFRMFEYLHFRRLFHVDIKNKERLSKVFRSKIICSQKDICNQKEICSQKKSAVKKKFAVKKESAMKNQESRFFQITTSNENSIKSDCFVKTKKSIFVFRTLFLYFSLKNFQVLKISTSEKKNNCHDLTSLHINFTH
jgi:hypothetical protein